MRKHKLLIVALLAAAGGISLALFSLFGHIEGRLERMTFIHHTGASDMYALAAPPSWHLDTSREALPVDVLTHQGSQSMIYIERIEDEALLSDASRFAMEQNIKKQFRQNPRYALEDFEHIRINGHNGFMMRGTRQTEDGAWLFMQYVLFSEGKGYAYNITGTAPMNTSSYTLERMRSAISAFSFE